MRGSLPTGNRANSADLTNQLVPAPELNKKRKYCPQCVAGTAPALRLGPPVYGLPEPGQGFGNLGIVGDDFEGPLDLGLGFLPVTFAPFQ